MDDGAHHQNGRSRTDYFKATQALWNMVPPHQLKEQTNALVRNKTIMAILDERNNAIQEKNQALAEKEEALAARDEAIQQRDKALAARDRALMERDNALAAIQYRKNQIFPRQHGGNQSGLKRIPHPVYRTKDTVDMLSTEEVEITTALPITTIAADSANTHQPKPKRTVTPKATMPLRKVNRVCDDLNQQVPSDVKKIKNELNSDNAVLNMINFDESAVAVPVCSCTGFPRQCYKWGNGGWQSSCCTTAISSYPLPQMPNKHGRIGGRKMSGSVFLKLLSRLAAEGHDVSIPLDLKDYWAKHGTNRYITIK